MSKTIDFNMLNNSKEKSKEYYANYGNNVLTPYFNINNLPPESRNADSDKIVLEFMLYGIKHYEKFKDEYGENEQTQKQSILFSICRSEPCLTNEALAKKPGLIDKYTIKHKDGFEDTNIFKDLRFLQKVTASAPTHPFQSDYSHKVNINELNYLLEDTVSSLKELIELELDSAKDKQEKNQGREQFKQVTKYPHIFSTAAYYREIQRSEDAIKYLDLAEAYMSSANSTKNKLFVLFRALTVTGEFSTQKNLTLQTKLNNPHLITELGFIKNLADIIVKPEKYFCNLDNRTIETLDFNSIKVELTYLRDSLVKMMDNVKNHQISYEDRVKYYTQPEQSPKPYLSQELIDKLKAFTQKHFPEITGQELKKLNQLFLSEKSNVRYITEITNRAKTVMNKDAFGLKMGQINKEKTELTNQLKNYAPPVDVQPPLEKIQAISTIKSILENNSNANQKSILDCTKEMLENLKAFVSINGDLPKVLVDDNPIKLFFQKLTVGEDARRGDVLLIDIIAPAADNSGTIRISEKIKIEINANIVSDLKNACNAILAYNKEAQFQYISVPKLLVNIEPQAFFLAKKTSFNHLINGINTHQHEFVEHIIEYGKCCNMYQYLKNPDHKLILEFYLQTTYNLINSLENDFEFINQEEYRVLRNSLRHFEDNSDVLEVEMPREQIYGHYAVKYIHEIEPKLAEYNIQHLNEESNNSNLLGASAENEGI